MKKSLKQTMLPAISVRDLLRYYIAYKDIEEGILNKLNTPNDSTRADGVKDYLSYMQIARVFKSNSALEIFHITNNYLYSNGTSIVELSELYAKYNLYSGKTQKSYVSASKLLWLFHKGVIIMDNVNAKIFNIYDSNYERYLEEWFKLYETNFSTINKIITDKRLLDIDPVFDEDWFKLRVFDQYLWYWGGRF